MDETGRQGEAFGNPSHPERWEREHNQDTKSELVHAFLIKSKSDLSTNSGVKVQAKAQDRFHQFDLLKIFVSLSSSRGHVYPSI